MRFRSAYSPHVVFASPSGSNDYVEYQRSKDDNGVDCLVKGCIHDRQAELKAAARGADISSIIRRHLNGDPSAVGSVDSSMFGDITGAPKDLLEAQRQLIKASNAFYDLPVALRNRYQNNPVKFMQALSDGSYYRTVASRVNVDRKATQQLTADDIAALKKMIGGNT